LLKRGISYLSPNSRWQLRWSARSANPDYASIVGPTRNELRKFARMQDSRENFQTVHNTRTRAREVCAGIYEIHLAASRGRNRTKTRKLPEQLVIAPRPFNIVSAKRKDDNLWARIQHLLPLDLCRRLMLPT